MWLGASMLGLWMLEDGMKLFGIAAVMAAGAFLLYAVAWALPPMTYSGCIERAGQAQTKAIGGLMVRECRKRFNVRAD